MSDQSGEIVILGSDGKTEHVFPAGFDPKRAAAIVRQQESGPQEQPASAAMRFLYGMGRNLDPRPLIGAVVPEALGGTGPVQTIKNIASAQAGEAGKALDAGRGMLHANSIREALMNLSEMAGHGVAAALPIVGPAAAAAGERIGSGDIAGGLGESAGLLAPFAASGVMAGARKIAPMVPGAQAIADLADAAAAKRVTDVTVPKIGPNKVRLGNAMEKVAPDVLKQTTAVTRGGLKAQIESGLADAEAALDSSAEGRSVAAQIPTDAVIQDLLAKRSRLTSTPIEGSKVVPEYVKASPIDARVPVTSARPAVSGSGAADAPSGRSFNATSETELFNQAYKDADARGYDGTKGEFRSAFEDRLAQARDLQQELASIHAEHGPQALLQAIKQYGGIGSDAQYAGEVAQLWENSTGTVIGKGSTKSGRVARSRTLSSGGFAGVPGVLKKTGGLSLDSMAEALRQDPRFENIKGPNELLAALDEARTSKARAPQLSEMLDAVGLRPGVRWWAGESTPMEAPDVPEMPSAPAAESVVAKRARPLGEAVVPQPNDVRVAQIDRAISELKRLGPVANYESIRRIRQAYDQPAKAVYSPSMTADYLAKRGESQGAADVTGVLRGHLAQADPATAAANSQYSIFKAANDVMDAAAEVERTRPTVGRSIMARGLGAAAGAAEGGGLGAMVGAIIGPTIERAMSGAAPSVKLMNARLLSNLADAFRGGQVDRASSILTQLSKVAKTAPRPASVGANVMPFPKAAGGPVGQQDAQR